MAELGVQPRKSSYRVSVFGYCVILFFLSKSLPGGAPRVTWCYLKGIFDLEEVTTIFTVALFTIFKIWKQTTCLSTDG